LRSPDPAQQQHAPFFPLLRKELWEVLGGRALWTMLLLMCPLVGYSYYQAISLYGEASVAGQQSSVLASSLSPLDGILVPTFGAAYVAVTLLFPFVLAMRRRRVRSGCLFSFLIVHQRSLAQSSLPCSRLGLSQAFQFFRC
jgi:hypothetical protein